LPEVLKYHPIFTIHIITIYKVIVAGLFIFNALFFKKNNSEATLFYLAFSIDIVIHANQNQFDAILSKLAIIKRLG